MRAFAVKPKGAAFEMSDYQDFIGGILATDCDFGPDGGFYVSDWVHGWDADRLRDGFIASRTPRRRRIRNTRSEELLAEGFDGRSVDDLAKLLEHADMRIRQEAQFALAAKREAVLDTWRRCKGRNNRFARFHAVWGLGQMTRNGTT